MAQTSDAIVVGGGVVGCAVAYALAREGLSVTLIERGRIGAQASNAAAGILAPLAEAEEGSPLFSAGIEALEMLLQFAAEATELSGIDPQVIRCGLLRVAFETDAPEVEARARRLADRGCEWLPAGEAFKREARLAPGIVGALWSPHEAHVDSSLLTRAYAAAAARRGARLELGVEATGLQRDGDRVCGVRLAYGSVSAPEVVLCPGVGARFWEEAAEASLPVEPVRGQMIALEAPRPGLESIVRGSDGYLVPRRDDSLLVGATVEHVGFDQRTTAEGIASLIHNGRALVPAIAGCTFLRAWAGLRPATLDGLPLIGALPRVPGLWVAAGHYRSGVLLSAFTGVRIAELIVHGAPRGGDPFDPARFGRPD